MLLVLLNQTFMNNTEDEKTNHKSQITRNQDLFQH